MKVTIMRGLPGCGKSTWIENAVKTSVVGFHAIVSADHYHYVTLPAVGDCTPERIYQFDPKRAREAHDKCFRQYIRLVQGGCDNVFVDNTNISGWEIAPYYRLAEVYGADVEIVWLRVPVETCIKRGVHNVPAATYASMAERLERESLPNWWKMRVITTE